MARPRVVGRKYLVNLILRTLPSVANLATLGRLSRSFEAKPCGPVAYFEAIEANITVRRVVPLPHTGAYDVGASFVALGESTRRDMAEFLAGGRG